ncbi:unnamed protein product [Sphagnum compactum]
MAQDVQQHVYRAALSCCNQNIVDGPLISGFDSDSSGSFDAFKKPRSQFIWCPVSIGCRGPGAELLRLVVVQQECRRVGFQESEWVDQSDRARVLWKMTELNRRANRAEQRVMELEQLLRDNAVMLQEDDDTASVDSALIAGAPRLPQRYYNHRIQEAQPCASEARRLAHLLSFCQSKFPRQHEMDRHQRIYRLQNSSLNSRRHRRHQHAQLLLHNSQNENRGLPSTFMIPSAHVLDIASSSPSLF